MLYFQEKLTKENAMSVSVTSLKNTTLTQTIGDLDRKTGDLNTRSVMILDSKQFKRFGAGVSEGYGLFFWVGVGGGVGVTAVITLAVGFATSFDPTKTFLAAALPAIFSVAFYQLVKQFRQQ